VIQSKFYEEIMRTMQWQWSRVPRLKWVSASIFRPPGKRIAAKNAHRAFG